MRKIHLANTDVEFELAQASHPPFEQQWSRHSLCLQLQFLPLLYADSQDFVAVTRYPTKDYLIDLEQILQTKLPPLVLISNPQVPENYLCLPWGHSPQVQRWTAQWNIDYPHPSNWTLLKEIHSKAFSYQFTPLPQTTLIGDFAQLQQWIEKTPGPKVLKSCYGLSGQGNRQFNSDVLPHDFLKFCTKEWQAGRPLIAEPWLERVEDFSTQWWIHPSQEIEWLGSTRFQTNAKGVYQGTRAGSEEVLFPSFWSHLQQHKQHANQALQKIAQLGYFGPIGIDAFIYHHNQELLLYPIVEINPRQTFSSVALCLQKRLAPQHTLQLSFFTGEQSISPSLLPASLLNDQGKLIEFHRRLTIQIN